MDVLRTVLVAGIFAVGAAGIAVGQVPPNTSDHHLMPDHQGMPNMMQDSETPMMMGMVSGCPMGTGDQHGRMMMSQGRMGNMTHNSAMTDRQLDGLRTSLAPRKNQMKAWNNYANAVKANARSMDSMRRNDDGRREKPMMSATDQLALQAQMMRTRSDSLAKLSSSASALYRKLDASQQASYDRAQGGLCGPLAQGDR